jgi:hypothetical protein
MHFPQLTTPDFEETTPCWSADGKTLYYARARTTTPLPGEDFFATILRIRYDLMKVDFDEQTLTFGEPEVVISSEKYQNSIFQPRTNNNGRFLIYTEMPSSTFPPSQQIANLRLLDLETNRMDSLTNINSDKVESWHSWSSESKWFVFSSKRMDDMFGYLYFGYIDSNGNAPYKPLLLPQKSPHFYKTYLHTYNIPELIKGSFAIGVYDFIDIVNKKAKPTQHRFVGESPAYKTVLKSGGVQGSTAQENI